MIYLSPYGVDDKRFSMDRFGIMLSPDNGTIKHIKRNYRWALDNGQFTKRVDVSVFISKMKRMEQYKATCLFVSALDVVGNAAETLKLYPEWRDIIRSHGYKAGFVGQDGLDFLPYDIDAFFIGGSTKWKLGEQARDLVYEAKRRGLWVHMGRVNSQARIHYAESIGCDSIDGTHIAFAPRRRFEQLSAWMNQKPLFYGGF